MFHVPYADDTIRIPDGILPGNQSDPNPVEYDIVPAWGPDLARLKSIMVACTGLAAPDTTRTDAGWTPEVQDAVVKGFEMGAAGFRQTITAIRGLTIPLRMALRAGLLAELQPGQRGQDSYPIVNGEQFSRICGALSGQALFVAMKIIELSGKQEVDPRFFAQPSGSGAAVTPAATTTTAGSARRESRRRGTAAARRTADNPQPGTSNARPS